MFRIGTGYDVHRLVSGRPLILGGVRIPHPTGLLGHSDADALAHALADALLGAAALGDIGQHFPDSDPELEGADSLSLLRQITERVRAAGWRPVNADATVIAQAPRLAPHIPAMRENLAAALGLGLGEVSVKATTPEGLDALGTEQGIAVQAVALLRADSTPGGA